MNNDGLECLLIGVFRRRPIRRRLFTNLISSHRNSERAELNKRMYPPESCQGARVKILFGANQAQ